MIRVWVLIALFVAPCVWCAPVHGARERWQGVDETVIERVAHEHGREARAGGVLAARGDLLPFFFLLAGAGGGFAAGYYWRKLTDRGRPASPGRR